MLRWSRLRCSSCSRMYSSGNKAQQAIDVIKLDEITRTTKFAGIYVQITKAYRS